LPQGAYARKFGRSPESVLRGAATGIGRAWTNSMRQREKPGKRALRDARLAAALRENLKRRKAQTRRRVASAGRENVENSRGAEAAPGKK